MSDGEVAYLALVLVGAVLFGVGLGWVSWWSGKKQ